MLCTDFEKTRHRAYRQSSQLHQQQSKGRRSNYSKGTVNVVRGTFTANTGSDRGGAICAGAGTVTISTADINSNAAGEAAGCYVAKGSNTITGNTAGMNAGGIKNDGTLKVSGNQDISENKANGKNNNLYLPSGKVIVVEGEPDSGHSQICVTLANSEAAVTSGFSAANDSSAKHIFISDRGKNADLNSSGEIVFVEKATYVDRVWDEGTQTVISREKTIPEYTLLSAVNKKDGKYTLNAGWYYAVFTRRIWLL